MSTMTIKSLYTRSSLIERTVDLMAELLGEEKVDYSDKKAVANLVNKKIDDDGEVH